MRTPSPFANPHAAPPACLVCDDLRVVQGRFGAAQSCPSCGEMGPESYAAFRRDRYRETRPEPELSILDLTPEEFAVFRAWQVDHAQTSKLTLLSWIEGRRYEPRKDPEFVAEVAARMAELRLIRDEMSRALGREPEPERKKAA